MKSTLDSRRGKVVYFRSLRGAVSTCKGRGFVRPLPKVFQLPKHLFFGGASVLAKTELELSEGFVEGV